jgi:transcriptional repressor NrdR
MQCPECNYRETRVTDSRDQNESMTIRRRRECLKCGARFTTYERIETTNLLVVKKNGKREFFSREKLASGLYKALEKRPYSLEEIDALIYRVERQIRQNNPAEIESIAIGEAVMSGLRDFDDVAYIRFASVYRSFADVQSFAKELEPILSRQRKRL